MSATKVHRSSLVSQAGTPLQGMGLEEVRKKMEALAEAERDSRVARAPLREGAIVCGVGDTR